MAATLSHLAQSNVPFDPAVAAELDTAVKKIDDNSATVEKAVKTDVARLSMVKQFNSLRPIMETISRMIFNLERLTG